MSLQCRHLLEFLPQPLNLNPGLLLGSTEYVQSVPQPDLGNFILLVVLVQSLALQVIDIGTGHLPILVHSLVKWVGRDELLHPLV